MVNSDVILSPLTVEDLGFLLEVRNDYSTRINLENDSIFSLDECRNWFKKLMNPWYLITAGENKVGYFRTNGTDIGCDIHPAHRRKGYARSSYLEYLKEDVQTLRRANGFPQDSELQNEIDNIANLINSTLYKLRYLA
jgi:hypothetical protein